VFSLSEIPDSLSQWRGYAPRGGYCIGFHQESVERIVRANGFELRRCEYKEDAQIEEVGKLLSAYLDSLSDWSLNEQEEEERIAKIRSHTEGVDAY